MFPLAQVARFTGNGVSRVVHANGTRGLIIAGHYIVRN